MIFDKLPWFVSMEPGTCFCLTKSALKSMNAFGGRGIYPCDRRLPGGQRFLVGGGAGVSEGGNSLGCELGDKGSGVEGEDESDDSLNVTGVTLGAKLIGRGGRW